MKTLKQATFQRWIREGRIEALQDVTRTGYVELRWTASNQRETIQIIDAKPGRENSRKIITY